LFILGIFIQDFFSLDENFVYIIIIICAFILAITFLKNYYLHKAKPYLLGFMFFGVGIILHFFNSFASGNVSIYKNETIVFKIAKKLNSSEKNRKYEGVIQAGNQTFNAVIYIPKSEKELDFLHYYQAQAYISKPKPPQYDFQFDYSKYLLRKNIEYQCYINNEIAEAKRKDLSFTEKFSQKRLEVLQRIDETGISSKSKEFLKGIILADRTEMDVQTVQDFNRSGLIHFLAISGTHIVIIFGLFYLLLIKILPLKFRKYAIISSLIFIWLFIVFIGFGSSVVRSGLMLSIYFVYVLLQRKPDLLHSLSLSAFIILIFDNQQLFDVGFQLSFCAVLGIYWLNQPILNYFPIQDNWLKKLIFNTISISVSAQLATLPLVLYYFHQFSFISIIANFFIVPFSEAIIVFSFLMTIFIAFHLDFHLMNVAYDFVIKILLTVIHWFADFSHLFIENIPMNLIEVFALFLIIYFLRFFILKPKLKNVTIVMTAVFAFYALRIGFNFYENNREEILFHDFSKTQVLSVKKGNNAFFLIEEDSDQRKMIQFIVNPYCSSRRISNYQIKAFPKHVKKVVYKGNIYDLN